MLNLLGPINKTSYGYVTLSLAKALQSKIPLYFQELVKPSDCESKDVDFVKNLLKGGKFYYNAPSIRIWHQHDMSYFIGSGEKIGFPIFELDRFTELEKYHLNFCDKLFVCSDWAKQICEKELNSPKVSVVNLGVDTEVFKPQSLNFSDSYIFLTCGKWERRKGHDQIIKAFNHTFSLADNVELWMVCNNPFLSKEKIDEWENLAKNSPLASKIKLIPRQNTQVDIARIMNMSSCGVFPALAEGFNLELMEMMACDKPVIATNYSAHTEYCTADNCYLIDGQNDLEVAYDEPFFRGQGKWLKPTEKYFDQLCSHMRYCYKNDIRNNPEGCLTAKQYSWDRSAQQILESI